MVDDKYPEFPKLECSACGERFEIPRKWVTTQSFGEQIYIDWASGEVLMKAHYQAHYDELAQGVEGYLASQA
jgi:hypothetical protein